MIEFLNWSARNPDVLGKFFIIGILTILAVCLGISWIIEAWRK